MGRLLYYQWTQIEEIDFSFSPWMMLLSHISLTLLFIIDALGWHLILRSLNHKPLTLDSIRIWMLSSLARYVPGGVWSYASRAEMARRIDIGFAVSGVSLYLETLMLAMSSLVIGIPSWIFIDDQNIQLWHIALFCLLLGLGMHPNVLKLLRYLPGKIGIAFSKVEVPSIWYIFSIFLFYIVFWCLFGICFVFFVSLLCPVSKDLWLPIASSISLSFFVGFVIIFIPGGVGIRESVLYFILVPYIQEISALLIAISSRIWIMTGEFGAVCLIEFTYRLSRKLKLTWSRK